MKLLTKTDIFFDKKSEYKDNVIFHFFWKGELNEKHLFSIKSCYFFNVKNKPNRKIYFWHQSIKNDSILKQIEKYAEVKVFNEEEEKKGTYLEGENIRYHPNKQNPIPEYVDFYRLLLLYKYGGCWVDIDILFLKPFDSLFVNFKDEICHYSWEDQNYPNNAVILCLKPKNERMRENINFIRRRNKGWGFQKANLTYDLTLNISVLHHKYFDAAWDYKNDPKGLMFDMFFKNTNDTINFNNFYSKSFCYHWHNRFNVNIEENSPCRQLMTELDHLMS
jgi:hypothetical protein